MTDTISEPPPTIPTPPGSPTLPETNEALTLEGVVQRIERKIAESEARQEAALRDQTIALIEVIDERFGSLVQGLELEREIRRRGIRKALAAASSNGTNGEKCNGDSGSPDADS